MFDTADARSDTPFPNVMINRPALTDTPISIPARHYALKTPSIFSSTPRKLSDSGASTGSGGGVVYYRT